MLKVLLIDDDAGIRKLLSLFLTKLDCDVLEASDGDEGESKALENRPEIVLLDVMLGRQDGYTTCAHLRDSGFSGYVLMVTAVPAADGRDKALRFGANAYMEKPITLPGLRLHIQQAQQYLARPSESSLPT
jgi:two-component system alkaline phosphatase synthesis response regulator PhoP